MPYRFLSFSTNETTDWVPTWRIVVTSLEVFRVEPLGQAVLEEQLREAEIERRVGR